MLYLHEPTSFACADRLDRRHGGAAVGQGILIRNSNQIADGVVTAPKLAANAVRRPSFHLIVAC